MRILSRFGLACAALLGASLCVHAQDMPHYELRLDAHTQMLSVRLCLAQEHAKVEFAADSATAMKYVHDLQRSDAGSLEPGETAWSATHWHAGACLSYRADLAAIASANEQDVGWRLGDDLVTAPQLWLLRPDVQGDADAEATVFLPPGWNISAPWHELKRSGNQRIFHIPNTSADWSVAVAFGHFDEERIELPGGVLRLTILHGADAQQKTRLHDWLAHVSRAVLSAYGRLPLPDVQVLMIPVGQLGLANRAAAAFAPRAVHFGQSIRGQGNALELLVDPARPVAEFDDDWVAVHELSHLMHPYLGDRGSWLAEGLATYYQNILRARAGLLTPAQAWDRLQEGFSRGAAQAGEGSLEQAAADMHRSHAFQRIYWSGAAYWLTVDRDLRRESAGKLSMELALSRFRDCCLPAYRQWRPEDFVARLDALLGVQTFSQRYREFAKAQQFPDWKKLYADLGIRVDGERLSFDAAAADAKVRDAITAARPEPAAESR
jgi:hypothetical protein